MKTDLSILFEKPEKDTMVTLTIEPLAPLSIVSTLPGSYYKSMDTPTKANLCGMFENVLGWHIGPKDRSKIFKKMEQVYKKSYKIKEFDVETSAVGYTSLLGHLFDIVLPLTPAIVARYDDLWTQHLKNVDERHLNGTFNIDIHGLRQKRTIYKELETISNDKNLKSNEKQREKDKIIKPFVAKYCPMYYSSPTPREFIVLEGNYQIKLSMSSNLLEGLEQSLQENNLAYLGTNEGWVDLSIKEM